jgi:hypothetical protein
VYKRDFSPIVPKQVVRSIESAQNQAFANISGRISRASRRYIPWRGEKILVWRQVNAAKTKMA